MKEKLLIGYLTAFPDASAREKLCGSDLVLVGQKAFGTVNFKSELAGDTAKLAEMGKLSKDLGATVFFAIKTDNYGLVRRSVAVFDGGKLIAIADANTPYGDFESTAYGYKTVKSKRVKLGVAVGNDIVEPDCIKTLALSESDAIINLYADFYNFSRQTLMQSLGYIYRVPIVSMGENQLVAVDSCGAVAGFFDNTVGCFELPIKKTYIDKKTKTRG